MNEMTISQEELHKLIDYDPKTGIITRSGEEIGTINFYKRRIIMIEGWRGWAAKLAWYYMTGDMPDVITVPERVDEGWSNFQWDRMRNDTGVTLKTIVQRKKRKERDGKGRVQSNGGADRKVGDHQEPDRPGDRRRSAKNRRVAKAAKRYNHRRRSGSHR